MVAMELSIRKESQEIAQPSYKSSHNIWWLAFTYHDFDLCLEIFDPYIVHALVLILHMVLEELDDKCVFTACDVCHAFRPSAIILENVIDLWTLTCGPTLLLELEHIFLIAALVDLKVELWWFAIAAESYDSLWSFA